MSTTPTPDAHTAGMERLLADVLATPVPPHIPGLSVERVAHVMSLGMTMLAEAGEDACREGYSTTDPFWVGHYALGYGDITEEGDLT